MSKPYDLSKPLVALDHESTLVCVIEMSGSSWLVAATVPGVDRRPLQKLPVDPARLLAQVERWRQEAARAGRTITRTVVAYESGRDGFWLARLLRGHGIEVYVIHASSVAVSREQRRAKTDRLDTEMLMRALLGWLRREPGHCRMVAIPTVAAEDARRPGRERDGLAVGADIRMEVRRGVRGEPAALAGPRVDRVDVRVVRFGRGVDETPVGSE